MQAQDIGSSNAEVRNELNRVYAAIYAEIKSHRATKGH
jgi:hypothetical protein